MARKTPRSEPMSNLSERAWEKFDITNIPNYPHVHLDAVIAGTNPWLLTRSVRAARRTRKAKLAEPESGHVTGNIVEAQAVFNANPTDAAAAELSEAYEARRRQLQDALGEAALADDISRRRRRLSRIPRLAVGAAGFVLAGIVGLGIGYSMEAQGPPQAPGTAPQQSHGPPHDTLQNAPLPDQVAILGGTALGALGIGAGTAYAVGGIAARQAAKQNLLDAKQSDA